MVTFKSNHDRIQLSVTISSDESNKYDKGSMLYPPEPPHLVSSFLTKHTSPRADVKDR